MKTADASTKYCPFGVPAGVGKGHNLCLTTECMAWQQTTVFANGRYQWADEKDHGECARMYRLGEDD